MHYRDNHFEKSNKIVETTSPQLRNDGQKLLSSLSFSHFTEILELELKVDEFTHEHLGQLNTYVSWFKKNVMLEGDNPPVGILLCTQKDHALLEYALAGMDNNLFVSKYLLELPKREEMQEFIEEQMKEVKK